MAYGLCLGQVFPRAFGFGCHRAFCFGFHLAFRVRAILKLYDLIQIRIGPGVILSRPDYGPTPAPPGGAAEPIPAPAPAKPVGPELNPPEAPAPPKVPEQPGPREF